MSCMELMKELGPALMAATTSGTDFLKQSTRKNPPGLSEQAHPVLAVKLEHCAQLHLSRRKLVNRSSSRPLAVVAIALLVC